MVLNKRIETILALEYKIFLRNIIGIFESSVKFFVCEIVSLFLKGMLKYFRYRSICTNVL